MTTKAPAPAAGERQVVLVSGGSRGLGQSLAADLLRRGHRVATFSRSLTPFLEERRQADPAEESFCWRALDGSDGEGVQGFVRDLARRYGRIDAVVNNAALGTSGVLATMRPGDIQRLLAVNLEGVLLLTRAVTRVMLQQGRGAILNISSVNALRGHAGVAVYSATKAALDGLTRSLARELGPRGIRVNSVAPGYFESDMAADLSAEQKERIARRTPLGRMGTVEDIVGAIRFLLSAEAAFITGQTLVVDGGITC